MSVNCELIIFAIVIYFNILFGVWIETENFLLNEK